MTSAGCGPSSALPISVAENLTEPLLPIVNNHRPLSYRQKVRRSGHASGRRLNASAPQLRRRRLKHRFIKICERIDKDGLTVNRCLGKPATDNGSLEPAVLSGPGHADLHRGPGQLPETRPDRLVQTVERIPVDHTCRSGAGHRLSVTRE